jgi:hypothetical protein
MILKLLVACRAGSALAQAAGTWGDTACCYLYTRYSLDRFKVKVAK